MFGKLKLVQFTALGLFLVLTGCATEPVDKGVESNGQKLWHYQLQNSDPVQLANSGYEIVVLDPSADGREETRFTEEQIDQVKANGTIALAYLSIGEASSYLSYWNPEWGSERNGVLKVAKDAPEWLGRVLNPDWPESVKVRYWQEEWWSLLKPQLDDIKKAGFDGVYLDIVDAYYYWGNEAALMEERHLATDPDNEQEAAERMMGLIERISAYLREESSAFQVFPQNAENIFDFDDGSYLTAIDGIGAEDLWYDETEKSPDTKERLSHLRTVKEAGKKVLSVDYVLTESPNPEDKKRIADYKQRCKNEGFYCFPAMRDRELDKLILKEDSGY